MAKRNRYYEDEKITYKFTGKSYKKALRYCVPYRKILISLIVLMLLFSFVSMLPPKITQYIIDGVILGDGMFGMGRIGFAIVLISIYAFAMFSNAIFTYFQ